MVDEPSTQIDQPELKIARRVIQKYNLTPPIAVEVLGETLMEIYVTPLPVEADALIAGLKQYGSKPRLFLKPTPSKARKRFTLAHEIGHVLIPWHVGTIVSHIDDYESIPDEIYTRTEAEANRFAAELLVPSAWLKEKYGIHQNPAESVRDIADTAQVSCTTASIALSNVLPPGYLFAEVDAKRQVLYSGRSKGTVATVPFRGTQVDQNLFALADSREELLLGANRLIWWRFAPAPVSTESEERSWREILRKILDDLELGEKESTFLRRLNGVVGAANSAQKGQTASELYERLRQRFSSRSDLTRIVTHADFKEFLRKKAIDVASGNK